MVLHADRRGVQEKLLDLHGVVQSSRTVAAQAEMVLWLAAQQQDCK